MKRRTLRSKTKTRQTRRGRIVGGDNTKKHVVFANNTKGGPGAPNKPTNIPNNGLAHLQNLYRTQIQYTQSPVQEENAHIFAKITGAHNNPLQMQRDLFMTYRPLELNKHDYTLLINLVDMAPMKAEQKDRIIGHFRYKRAAQKLQKLYGDFKDEEATVFRPVAVPAQKMSPMDV